MRSLKLLDLSLNQFTGKIPSSLISNLTSLEYLDLGYNHLEGRLSFSAFSNHSNLEVVVLSSDNDIFEVETESTSWVPQFQLKILSLAYYNLNKQTGIIPKFLSQQYDLIVVDLPHNDLKGEFLSVILENNRRLEFLNLRNNSLRGEFPLPPYPNIYTLWVDASHNHLGGQLQENMKEMFPYLRYLNLSGNGFEGHIPSSICNQSSTLAALDLSKNNFSGEVPGHYPMDCQNASATIPRCEQQLYVRNRRFNEDVFRQKSLYMGMERFVIYIYRKSRIERDFYKMNERGGEKNDHQQEKQDQFKFITKNRHNTYKGDILNFMSGLDLSCNNLTSDIPYELGQLSSIHALNLSYNHFIGFIPKSFSNLSSLESLDLSYNNLSGEIPSELAGLNFLIVFSVAHNNLSGIQSCRHLSTSLAAVARLANLAEEVASVNHPDSRNPDADVAEAVCATPMEEVGAESQSQPSDDPDRLALVLVTGPPSKKPRSVRNLRSGLLGRLQERQQEIEVSCSSAHDAHPEGGEVEMVTETPAVPVVVPLRLHPGSPFSYAELEEKLKQIPPGLPIVKPSAQMFEMVETINSGEWSPWHGNQYDLFTDLLRTTDYMKAFAARHKDTEDHLRLRLVEAEASISTARRENEALRADLADAKVREESMDARLLEAANEMAGLRGEVRQLRTEVSIERNRGKICSRAWLHKKRS
ncbi:Brassinosteroid LRR receptor kinase BRL3 [Vitis vinifera]|uniref:Brassinosteroid LRR receptor kinase BRL3 n=1 Tax=Vitis vinifera TaxID=29760 RepID=A0A438GJ94_VITVI|nr:Brassinosteroid LRR receptor kinase BRL3 [Vitis vinifera]